ncbi:MAG: WG repeat-containing protein [Reichenbachiella sp.]|uniref:WG repeat-containing protein n=5 Tax=Reichenbachiella sp. TaxID=2184521 RepID=UPI0032645827
MKKGLLYFTALLLFVLPIQLSAEKTKQALRALDKGDFEKVEEILTKSMREDSLNPATEYVWALLYSNEDYPKYHLDTAHIFIQYACEHFRLQDEDHLDELDDADLYEYDLKNKKIAIDSLAFARATSLHTIKGYEHFITYYFDAADFAEAVSIRNQLEFEEVQSEHTWQAYREFMSKFPFAAQFPKARIQYDKLVYEARTKTGRIDELEEFLKDEPKTPYRHSIEKKIFEDYVGELNPERMMDFLHSYSNPVFSSRTLKMLFHIDGFDFSSISDLIQVSDNFMDSVSQLEVLNKMPLTVTLRNDRFHFLDLEGNQFLTDSFQSVKDKYRCGNVLDDLLVVQSQNKSLLLNRNGAIVFEGNFDQVNDLGSGLLAITENGKVGLIHKSGFRLLPADYDDLLAFHNGLLVFEQEENLGVMGVTGNEYVRPQYDNISINESFWVFEKNGLFGVANISKIKAAKGNLFSIEMPFEEVEVINKKYIIGFEDDAEVLIDHDRQVLSPPSTKRINTRHETWVLELADGYTTFDPELGKLSSNVYQNVTQNIEWLGLARNDKWFVYNKNIYDEPIIGVDSLKLLGEDIAIIFRGSAGMAIFPNKKLVEIVEDQYLKSIGPKLQTDTHYLVIREKGENILFKDGVEQFRIVCDELGYISDSAFYVKKNGSYGAVGLDGRLIMRIRYDAISQADNGVAPVLYRGKFGAYNFSDRILLRMDYQEKLKSYNADLFIVNADAKYGLLDRFNQVRVVPEYEKIAYWSDTTFLGQKDGQWAIVDVKSNESVLSGVHYYEYIKDSPDEKILLIRNEDGYGIYHSAKGIIIPTVFHDVINLGNDEKQLYFTETAVSEAGIYVVVYYDSEGNKISSEAYRSDVYENLVCED